MPLYICAVIFLSALYSCNSGGSQPNGYQAEASLPEGWPAPGPFNQVTEKLYPAYRAAYTGNKSERTAFFTLFEHINQQSLPMTAPVEMQVQITQNGTKETNMAFLYPSNESGKPGTFNGVVEVRDVPSLKALSYAWKGKKTPANIKMAKDALTKEILKRQDSPKSYRLLGYNGPGTPKNERVWELQAILGK